MTSIARSLLAVMLSAGLFALAACGGATPTPAAPPTPAAAPVAAETPAAADPCDPLRVTVGPGAIDRSAVEDALDACAGGSSVVIAVDGDLSYDDVVQAMDRIAARGHDISLDSPELPALETRPALPAPADLDAEAALRGTPILIMSTSAVTLRAGDTLHNLAARPELDDAGVRKLYDTLVALRTAQPELSGTLVLQADRTTRSPTILRAIAGAKAAGFTSMLFAVKNR